MLTLIELTEVELTGRRASSEKSLRRPSSEGIMVNILVWSAAMTVVGVGSVEQIAMMLPGPAGPRTSTTCGSTLGIRSRPGASHRGGSNVH